MYFEFRDNYWIVFDFSGKLTSASKEALASHTSPNSSPNSIQGSRRGSISSVSSVSSVLDEKDDDRIRCCRHCKGTLLKREQQIDEREFTPEIVKLYEVNLTCYTSPESVRRQCSPNGPCLILSFLVPGPFTYQWNFGILGIETASLDVLYSVLCTYWLLVCTWVEKNLTLWLVFFLNCKRYLKHLPNSGLPRVGLHIEGI